MNLVETFRAFAEPSRLRILHLLLQQPLCVCHLQELLDLPQVNVSQHLAYLRKAGLVEFSRVQTWKVYRWQSPRSRAVELSLRCVAESAKSDPALTSDLKRLPRVLKTYGKALNFNPLHREFMPEPHGGRHSSTESRRSHSS